MTQQVTPASYNALIEEILTGSHSGSIAGRGQQAGTYTLPGSAIGGVGWGGPGLRASTSMGGSSLSGISLRPSWDRSVQGPSLSQIRVGAGWDGGISKAKPGSEVAEPPREKPYYETHPANTDWDWVADWIKKNGTIDDRTLKQPAERPVPGEDEMAVDWGDILTTSLPGVIGAATSKFLGPDVPNYNLGPINDVGWVPPAKVTVDTHTGKVTPCRRRRRKRLLTPTDLSDLAALQAIVGKGDALKLAVAKAVRR